MQDFRKLMKQAQEMQTQMQRMQEQLAEQQIDGTSGGGMVTVTMNGRYEVIRIKIDPQVVSADDVEMLEDLVAAACNDAASKVQEKTQAEMGKLTGGLGLPGMF
jgi:nucleoid-associated protein EbfC